MMQMHYFHETCTLAHWEGGLPLFTELPRRVEPIKNLKHTGEPDRGEWIIPGELHV